MTFYNFPGLLITAKKEENEKIHAFFPDIIIRSFIPQPRGRAESCPHPTGAQDRWQPIRSRLAVGYIIRRFPYGRASAQSGSDGEDRAENSV